jgi:hypothetical protein
MFLPLFLSAFLQGAQVEVKPDEKALIQTADEVGAEVEALRGWKFKQPVKKGVYNEAELRKYLEKKAFEEEYGGGKLEKNQAFLRMTGLIPPTCDLKKTFLDVLLNQIGGFYDPDVKAFYMLRREGSDYGPLLTRTMIAHELTHALDDQYFDLGKVMKALERTEDWGLTIQSVTEGSATALMFQYLTQAQKSGKYDTEDLKKVAKEEAERGKVLFEAPPYFATLAATYYCGTNFLLRGKGLGALMTEEGKAIGDRVRHSLQDLPRSTEQILHPAKYWESDRRDDPVEVQDKVVLGTVLAGTGSQELYRDTLGEMLCALLTHVRTWKLDPDRMGASGFWTNTAATGWGGDRFYLLTESKDVKAWEKEPELLRGLWITAWDTPKDRAEFLEELAKRPVPGRGEPIPIGEKGVAFLFSAPAALAETVAKSLPAAAGELFQRKGKPWVP